MGTTGIAGIAETTGIMVIMGVFGIIAATDVAATAMAWVGTKALAQQGWARSQGSRLRARL
ncbi:MAG: hypothetical protein ACRDTX_21540 [Pseudonocardiaceae bacterium]